MSESTNSPASESAESGQMMDDYQGAEDTNTAKGANDCNYDGFFFNLIKNEQNSSDGELSENPENIEQNQTMDAADDSAVYEENVIHLDNNDLNYEEDEEDYSNSPAGLPQVEAAKHSIYNEENIGDFNAQVSLNKNKIKKKTIDGTN